MCFGFLINGENKLYEQFCFHKFDDMHGIFHILRDTLLYEQIQIANRGEAPNEILFYIKKLG